MQKETLSQVRKMFARVALETDCNLRVNRIGRSQTITFELVPDGSSYGPMMRVNAKTNMEALLNNGQTEMVGLVNQLKAKMSG